MGKNDGYNNEQILNIDENYVLIVSLTEKRIKK
jgi:hypothetical protein